MASLLARYQGMLLWGYLWGYVNQWWIIMLNDNTILYVLCDGCNLCHDSYVIHSAGGGGEPVTKVVAGGMDSLPATHKGWWENGFMDSEWS